MNKKILALLCATALLLACLAACGKKNEDESTSADTTAAVEVTGTDGDTTGTDDTNVTVPDETDATTTPASVDETDPTFTDVSKQVYIFVYRAVLRSATVVNDTTAKAWPSEGTVLDVTGESENWYRINRNGETLYVAKTVVFDYSLLQNFTEVNETVTISQTTFVRSIPSTLYDQEGSSIDSKRGTLKAGDTVTRVGVSENWSCILFDVKDAEGNVETKKYYVSNASIKADAAETTTAEETTEAEETTTVAEETTALVAE